MRALVTGAGGFIGRRLVAELAGRGWMVGAVRRGVVADAAGPDDLIMGAGAPEDFVRLLSSFSPDVVFHLAGRMVGSAEALYAANAVLATNLLRAIEQTASPPTVVLAGSAAEYGQVDARNLPVAEDHPCAPISDYAVSKHAQTLAGLARARLGLPVLVARIFNPVGGGMPSNLALPSFAAQFAGRSEGEVRVGDLDVERDFIEVGEAARLMAALASEPSNLGGVFNICSGQGYNLRQLVDEMARLSGGGFRVVVDPARLRASEVRQFVGSTARLRAAGLEPTVPDMSLVLQELLSGARAAARS